MQKIIIILLAWLVASLGACIQEDRDECPAKNIVHFRYLADSTVDVFPQKIKNVHFMVFNADRRIVYYALLGTDRLNQFQGNRLNLLPGTYAIIAWSNVNQETQIQSREYQDLGVIIPTDYVQSRPINTEDSLYYGYKVIQVTELSNVHDTMYFEGAHIKVNVRLSSSDSTYLSDVGMRWNDLPLSYNFIKHRNTQTVTYVPDAIRTNAFIRHYKFNTLQIPNANPVQIEFYQPSSGNSLATFQLSDLLTTQSISLEGRNEVLLHLNFSIDSWGIQIKPWEGNDVDPGVNY